MKIQELMKLQKEMMAGFLKERMTIYNNHGEHLDFEKANETRLLVLALTDELHELLRETPWKPWKKSYIKVDQEKVLAELCDCWHFMMELTLLWGMEEKLVDGMKKTFEKNLKRANSGY